ncbi:hypothetical protein [Rhodococcus erythropolis]|uniref:hypothetical protein n=1 Tax=Rhodococcus erythropolis TaxID=1833 RepID=UPI003013D245
MIVAKADSISTLRATAFFAATAIAISTLAGCSTGPSTGDAQALSFEGLEFPSNIDVDSAGNVFVTDWGHDRVVRLGDATNEQSEVPFRGLTDLASITVGSEGSVYVSEGEGTNSQGRILKMPAGGTSQEVLTTREHPGALAVSDSGVVYFYDFGSPVVYKFIPETKSTEIEVALVHTNFPGFDQYFNDIALGNDGKLVAITGLPDPRILRVLSSQMLEELPFLKGKERFPTSIDINKSGDMVILDGKLGDHILKVPNGSTEPIELSFGELNQPSDVAIDDSGNVYVADRNNHRVLKLQAND